MSLPESLKDSSIKTGEPRKALGRGLAALLGDGPGVHSGTTDSSTSPTLAKDSIWPEPRFIIEEVELGRIEANPEQPRKNFNTAKLEELAASLREHGLVQPIIVRKLSDQKYQIVAGERRWRAAGLAGLAKIPVIVRETKLTDLDNDLASLVENIQREELNPIELAVAYDRLLRRHAYTQEELSSKLGISRVSVANTLRLLKLPRAVQDLVNSRSLSEGHSRALLALDSEQQMLSMAQQILDEGLTVREVEMKVRSRANFSFPSKNDGKNGSGPSKLEESTEVGAIEEELRKLFGTKVGLRGTMSRGAIEIFYVGKDSLHRLLHQLRSVKE